MIIDQEGGEGRGSPGNIGEFYRSSQIPFKLLIHFYSPTIAQQWIDEKDILRIDRAITV